MAEAAGAMYLNMGTILPLYEASMPRTVQCLARQHKNWVLDPVGIGVGGLREKLLRSFRQEKPGIIRGNASELMLVNIQVFLVVGIDVVNDGADFFFLAVAFW